MTRHFSALLDLTPFWSFTIQNIDCLTNFLTVPILLQQCEDWEVHMIHFDYKSGDSSFLPLTNRCWHLKKKTYCIVSDRQSLKVHKNENIFGFDFKFCTISMLVMRKNNKILVNKILIGPLWGELRLFRVVLGLRGMEKFFKIGQKNFLF